MMIYTGDYRCIHNKLNNKFNIFSEELSEIERDLEKQRKWEDGFYSDVDYKKYYNIYSIIEENKSTITSLIEDVKLFQYCGNSLKKVFKKLEINDSIIQNEGIQKVDNCLYIISSMEKNFRFYRSLRFKRDYIYVYTIFSSYVDDLIRIVYQRLSQNDIGKILNRSLKNKIAWLESVGKKPDIDLDDIEYLTVQRNVIVHNNCKYNIKSLKKYNADFITKLNKYNIKDGDVISFSYDKLNSTYLNISTWAIQILETIKEIFLFDDNTIVKIKQDRQKEIIKLTNKNNS